jgi:phosphoglycolate phosphatase-like HAD superfamily hydrolase
MNLAFERLHGHQQALEGVPIAGRTDRAIVTDIMQRIGVEASDATIGALHDEYIACLRTEIRRPVAHPCLVLPGVTALLDALDAQPGIVTALLTGNFERGAEIKLRHFDIWERFQFGAFGDRHTDRRALVPVAVARAREAGHVADDPDRIVIIGDTPNDVDCAKAYGARVIAVATGPFDRVALDAAGADLTVETLEDVSGVMAEIRRPLTESRP